MPVEGWREDGLIERSTWFSRDLRGRTRATVSARSFASIPRPDLIWTSASQPVLPYTWSQLGPLKRPLVLDLDWTFAQQEQMAPAYFSRAPRTGRAIRFGLWRERTLWRSVSLFTPWSNWAADSLRAQGVGSDRIRVLPPGIDLEQWQPAEGRWSTPGPLRVLFVGADFVRKGGDLVIEAARKLPTVEFDVVTPSAIQEFAPVRVHRATANSPELRALFAKAHLFVLPSRADCFGLATVEAMASGLPVVVSDVGGARDIVEPGVTGWLTRPDIEDLVQAIRTAESDRGQLERMGNAGRLRAERLFNGAANDRAVADLMLELLEPGRSTVKELGTEAGR